MRMFGKHNLGHSVLPGRVTEQKGKGQCSSGQGWEGGMTGDSGGRPAGCAENEPAQAPGL